MLAFVSSINGNYAVVLIELRDTNFWEANTIRWRLFFLIQKESAVLHECKCLGYDM